MATVSIRSMLGPSRKLKYDILLGIISPSCLLIIC